MVLSWERVTDDQGVPGNHYNVDNSNSRDANAYAQDASMDQPRDHSSGRAQLFQDGPNQRVAPYAAGDRTTQMTPAAPTVALQNPHSLPYDWINTQGQCIPAASVPAPSLSSKIGARHRILVKISGLQFTLDAALKKSASSSEDAEVWLEAEQQFLKTLIEQMADVSPNERQVLLGLADVVPNMIFPVSTLTLPLLVLN